MANNIFTVLSPEEIKAAVFEANSELPAYGSGSAEHWNAEYKAIAKAQKLHTLQQVVEWGEVLCPHYVGGKFRAKRECKKCWQELKALVAKVKER